MYQGTVKLFNDIRKGSFSGWAEVADGVLKSAGYKDFLGNEKTFDNEDRVQERDFVNFMLEIFKGSDFTAKDVCHKIRESQFVIYLSEKENGETRFLGNVVFKKLKNRVFEIDGQKVKLVQTGKHSKGGALWNLEGGEIRYTSDTPHLTVGNNSKKGESAQNAPTQVENRYTTDTPDDTPHLTIRVVPE